MIPGIVAQAAPGASSGTVFFTDDFNRANENLEVSPNWTRHGGAAGDIRIEGNQLRFVGTADGIYYTCPDIGTANHYVEARRKAAAGGDYFLAARIKDANNFISFRRWDTGSTRWSIHKRVAGTFTELARLDSPTGIDPANVVCRLEVVGNYVTVYLDGVRRLGPVPIGAHDNTGTGAGFVLRNQTANPAYDDFSHGAASFTAAAAPNPVINKVLALISFDGVDEAVAANDDGPYKRPVRFQGGGTARLDNGRSKFGTTSLRLDGTSNDYVDLQHDFGLSASQSPDYCLEAWVWFDSFPSSTNLRTIFNKRPGSSAAEMSLYYGNGGSLSFGEWAGGSDVYAGLGTTATGVVATGQWHHIAVSREGRTARIFVDGVMVHAVWASGLPSANASAFRLGRDGFDNTRGLIGNISEFRYTKHDCLYYQNFIPPTAPFPRPASLADRIVFLMYGEGADGNTTFVEHSPVGHAAFSAFGNAQNDTGVNIYGTSILFDGNGDYVQAASSDFGTMTFPPGVDFCFEGYVRTGPSLATSANENPFSNRGEGTSSAGGWFLQVATNGQATFGTITATGTSAGTAASATGAFVVDTTYHVACVRQGTALRLYINGVLAGSGTESGTNLPCNSPLRLGRNNNDFTRYWHGSLNWLRMTVGSPRYTADFTPPVPPY